MTKLNQAIEEYERALNEHADLETVYHLAALYAQRGGPGDARQAADLYYTLGDVLGHPGGLAMLQRALVYAPDHADARKLLAQYESMPSANVPANQQTLPARPALGLEKLGSAPRMLGTSSGDVGARPQPEKDPKSTSRGIGPRTAQQLAPTRPSHEPRPPTAAPSFARGMSSASEHAAPRLVPPAPAGGVPRKTSPGIAPAVMPANLASDSKIFSGAGDARRGSAALSANRVDVPLAPEPASQGGTSLRVARDTELAAPSAKAPPLAAAERRAAGQVPGPHAAPVITIVQPTTPNTASVAMPMSTTPSAASMSPSGATAPVTSLSPVVTDEGALERSRARLSATRARKRTIMRRAIGATAVSALGLFLVLPYSMQDAPQVATRVLGRASDRVATASVTTTASRPESELQPMAAEPLAAKETRQPPPAETATTTPTPAPNAPTQQTPPALAHEPEPTMPAAGSTVPEMPAGTVRPLLDRAKLRGAGKLTDQQLMRAFEKAAPKLEQCYADALEKKPKLKGRLIFSWTVRPNGKAAGVKKQGGTIRNADLARCTVDAISGTKFPKPTKQQEVLIRLPFEYKKS